LKVDGISMTSGMLPSWFQQIAHVPQDIFLADASIAENIAFGVDAVTIDQERLILAAKSAGVADIINSLPSGYDTFVGERGVKLSGGQKQRIGIARALYKNAKVIVLDEATSALDPNTEHSVMSSINLLNADITILMVSHRVSTLANCNFIVEIDNGAIKRICKYSDIANLDPKAH
jgi:ATP-binding cassette subfamily B protein